MPIDSLMFKKRYLNFLINSNKYYFLDFSSSVNTDDTLNTSTSIVNVNIDNDICISKNSCNIEQCDIPDKPISNSAPCDTNISDVIKDLTNVHGDVLLDKSRNLLFHNNNVINGKPFVYVRLIIHAVHSKIYLQ